MINDTSISDSKINKKEKLPNYLIHIRRNFKYPYILQVKMICIYKILHINLKIE